MCVEGVRDHTTAAGQKEGIIKEGVHACMHVQVLSHVHMQMCVCVHVY